MVQLSLHASGDWHTRVRRRRVHQWHRPAQLPPGYTRALAIVQPVAVATVALPAPADAHLLKLPREAEPALFDVWMCGSSGQERIRGAGRARMPAVPPWWDASRLPGVLGHAVL